MKRVATVELNHLLQVLEMAHTGNFTTNQALRLPRHLSVSASPPYPFSSSGKTSSIWLKSRSETVKLSCKGNRLGFGCCGRGVVVLCCFASHGAFRRTKAVQVAPRDYGGVADRSKKRVFFLDVNPLCYRGSTPSFNSFAFWVSLFFSQVSLNHPVIAVIDGERGNEYRRQLLPSYKAHRMKFQRVWSRSRAYTRHPVEQSHEDVIDVLRSCNVPVVKVEGHEADDVVSTLVRQALERGYKAVIASPDKDFKQLISEDVQLVIPLPERHRWSFYTLKHYIAQYDCDPCSDLSLRCILGDDVDGVPGIQSMVPGFGRKTALKLLKKHGSLENLLNAASVRTVGKPYAQEALTKYADFVRRNYQVLSLKRDVDVHLENQWLYERDTSNDTSAMSMLHQSLEGKKDTQSVSN